jgi:SAM-dependent methyltransferase
MEADMELYGMYEEVVRRLLYEGILDEDMKILVICGDGADREVLQKSGLRNVIISSVDTRMEGGELSPFEWSFQDAENLNFKDLSFDFSIVHWGLHHCHSPHRALLEMYRISKRGLLMFEPSDNLLTRLGVRLNFGQEYEHANVFHNDFAYGGVKNTFIPNYVYRWTESEIKKTINCYAPYGDHRFKFFYEMRVPWPQLKDRKNRFFYYAVLLSLPLLKIMSYVFPKQSNNFAAVVLKPEFPRDLHPWFVWEENKIKLNKSWLATRYGEETKDAYLSK